MRRLLFILTGASLLTLTAGATCFDVYIIAGQSNMDGRGEKKDLPPVLAKPQADVKFFYANPVTSTNPLAPVYQAGWMPLAPGYAIPPKFTNSLPSERFGPELSFGRALADASPQCHIALIKVTEGNTSLSKDWNPANKWLYATLTNTVKLAMNQMEKQGDTCTLRGMIWHQGESDVTGGAEKYSPRLAAFITSVRRDFEVPELPFVIGEVATNKDVAFRSMQARVASETPRAAFVSADGLKTVEGTHFNSASVVQLGERFAAEITKLRLAKQSPVNRPVAELKAGSLAAQSK